MEESFWGSLATRVNRDAGGRFPSLMLTGAFVYVKAALSCLGVYHNDNATCPAHNVWGAFRIFLQIQVPLPWKTGFFPCLEDVFSGSLECGFLTNDSVCRYVSRDSRGDGAFRRRA